MIASKIIDTCDDGGLIALLLFGLFGLGFGSLILILTLTSTSWKIILFVFIVSSEIIYHIEPRDKKEKKEGRDWDRVILKKLDSLFVVSIVFAIFTFIHEIFKNVSLEMLINFMAQFIRYLTIGIIIFVTIFIYLWLNKLRDSPRKK